MYEKLYYKGEVGYGFHYLKYTPKKKAENGKYPLVVFMHGAGERGTTDGAELDLVARHGWFGDVAQGKEFPFMMVGPQCPRTHFWGEYIESLNRFLDTIIAENDIDTDRIYLTGLSMGGTATWLWGQSNPERFAAFAPVCGEGITWYGEKFIDKPVRTFHGDIDSTVSPHESLEMVSSINKRGGHAELILFPCVKHDAWNYAYKDELVDWLMSHKLTQKQA